MGRYLIFLYGLVSYLVFFVVFLYMIGWLGGMGAPRSIEDGPTGPLWPAAAIDLALVLAFGVQHSVMARPWFKTWWTRLIPAPAERSTYVLAASLLLALLMWQWRPIGRVVWAIEPAPLRIAIWFVFFAGGALIFYSTLVIDHFDLFGLRQVWLHLRGRPYTPPPFVERTIYKTVRHPLMLGFLIAFWAAPTMTMSRLVFAAALTGYILLGVRVEERDLARRHGDAYQRYRERTPALLPRLRRPGGKKGGA